MLKTVFLLIIGSIALDLQAGPKGYFRSEKGALIHGEVLYADDNFYYYRRISNPDKILTVEIENVPASFQRLVNSLRLKGEIIPPPESIAKRKIYKVSENPYGHWQVKKMPEEDRVNWYYAVLKTNDDQGQNVSLIVRYSYKEPDSNNDGYDAYDGYLTLDIYLLFDQDVIPRNRNYQVTYQFESNAPVTERWTQSANNPKALFSYLPYLMRDKLLEFESVSFKVNDLTGKARHFSFQTGHFEKVYNEFFQLLDPNVKIIESQRKSFKIYNKTGVKLIDNY